MTRETGKQAVLGALAGAAGTALLQGLMAGSRRFAPRTLPPMRQDPGQFMVERASRALPRNIRRKIPEQAKTFAAASLGFGYGASFGALFAAMRRGDDSGSAARIVTEGAALGATTWAVGYVGWLPRTRLMPPLRKQRAKQVVSGVLSHVLFGITTVAVLRWVVRRI